MKLLLAIVALGLAGCHSAPRSYKGQIDGQRYSVPAILALAPVNYVGEDDWHAPLKQKSSRTFEDNIDTIEFVVHSNLPSRPADIDVFYEKYGKDPFVYDGKGSWVLVQTSHAEYITPRDMMNLPNQGAWLFPSPTEGPTIYGLRSYKSDRRSPDYSDRNDAFYVSKEQKTVITCSSNQMMVKPFADISQCDLMFLDGRHHLFVLANFMRADLQNWHRLKDGLVRAIETFRAP